MVVEVMGGLDGPGSIRTRPRAAKGPRKTRLENSETDSSRGPKEGIGSRVKAWSPMTNAADRLSKKRVGKNKPTPNPVV